MVITANSFYGPGPTSAMGLWSVNVYEETLQEKRMVASDLYPPGHQQDEIPQMVKQELGDDVPDLDDDEYSPQGSMDKPWLNGMDLSVDPAFDVPPELEVASGPAQQNHFTPYLNPTPMATFGRDLDVPSFQCVTSVSPRTTPLAEAPRVTVAEVPSIKSECQGAPEGTITSKRAKNAAAARRSRARQTIRVQTLEAKLDSMSTDNLCLKYEVEKLRGLVMRLQQKIVDHGLTLDENERLETNSKSTQASS